MKYMNSNSDLTLEHRETMLNTDQKRVFDHISTKSNTKEESASVTNSNL